MTLPAPSGVFKDCGSHVAVSNLRIRPRPGLGLRRAARAEGCPFPLAGCSALRSALYEEFCTALAAEGTQVETGIFGARMAVALVNHGPVTIVLG
jgi:hypothetical protein